ncbi:MAG: tRNA pseudouridine(55) synthase TruB [Pseudomonadota bacterium]
MGKRRGRDISGWLIIDKPPGVTSTTVVNKIRWVMDARKAGHAGTLDPEASGLLAVALGEATKTVPYVTDAMKAYRFTVRLGQATNTDDIEGEVISKSDLRPTDAQIKAALPQFVGDILQVPPQFSAVKIDGERAYKRARDGEAVEIAARPLFVESLALVERSDPDHVTLELICGKGGYVRSIARDLGQVLGCFAHVHHLRRIWSEPFTLEDAVPFAPFENAQKTADFDAHLLPLEVGLDGLAELPCSPEAAARLRHGNPAMVLASDLAFGEQAWASLNGQAVAVGAFKGGELHPKRVFMTQDL